MAANSERTTTEITIRKIGTDYLNGDFRSSDITNTYLVVNDGKEFVINLRTHVHGSNLALSGHEGVLYADTDENTVRRQVITVGKSCGISIESDEVVEGLSPWALHGVVLANRSKEAKEIRLNIDEQEKSSGSPVVLIDGRPQDSGVLD
jgi:hypothetical protein